MDLSKKRIGKRASDAWRSRVGGSIRRARSKAGLTQSQLGDLVGIAWTTLSRIERGEVVPDYATVEAVADRLGLAIDDLTGRITQQSIDAEGESHLKDAPLPPEAVLDSFEDLQGQIDAIREFVGMRSEPAAKRAWRRSA